MHDLFRAIPRTCACGHQRVDTTDVAFRDGTQLVVHGLMHCYSEESAPLR